MNLHLPGAKVLNVALPLAFGVFAAMPVALPARLSASTVLAPAALVLWMVWLLWAYPAMTYRNGEFVIRNPLRSVSFSASTEVVITGTGVPRIRHGSRSVRPVVMLVSPGGSMDTMRAGQGVTLGANVVSMETLAPGFEAHSGRASSVLHTSASGPVTAPPTTPSGGTPQASASLWPSSQGSSHRSGHAEILQARHSQRNSTKDLS